MIDDRRGISHTTLSHWITRKPSTGKHMSIGVEYKPLDIYRPPEYHSRSPPVGTKFSL